jgi:hypothetical protein
MRKVTRTIAKAKAKAEATVTPVKRGNNLMTVLRGEAETLGAAIRVKGGELSDAKIKLGEALRDRIVAKEICAHEGTDAKKKNVAEANQYCRWAYPELKTEKSAGVRTSQLLSFALPNVVETTPDYRGAFRKWVETTTSKARGGSDYFDSCVKLNRAVEKDPKAKMTPAFFAKAHVPKPKAAPDPKKAAAKARDEAKASLIEAAKFLKKDRSLDADIKAAIDALLAKFA